MLLRINYAPISSDTKLTLRTNVQVASSSLWLSKKLFTLRSARMCGLLSLTVFFRSCLRKLTLRTNVRVASWNGFKRYKTVFLRSARTCGLLRGSRHRKSDIKHLRSARTCGLLQVLPSIPWQAILLTLRTNVRVASAKMHNCAWCLYGFYVQGLYLTESLTTTRKQNYAHLLGLRTLSRPNRMRIFPLFYVSLRFAHDTALNDLIIA